jgi:hypothetical protein
MPLIRVMFSRSEVDSLDVFADLGVVCPEPYARGNENNAHRPDVRITGDGDPGYGGQSRRAAS